MISRSSSLLLAALAGMATAFPANVMEQMESNLEARTAADRLLKRVSISQANAATAVFEPVPIFNAEAQAINVGPGSGHEWQAPGPDDIRGPCPGLNAFANHGFLPRNGYATAVQFLDITMSVVGMGPGLAAFLAVFGAAMDGDGLAWSIGGTPTLAIAGPIGDQAHGISGSHNKYESDASPTRPDLYESGNDYLLQIDQFQQLINMSPGNQVNLESLTEFRSTRFDQQVANNKYFFNGPFTGVLVQPAAYTFIYRFMANHSEANPHGLLSHENLQSWFGVTGTSGKFSVKPGYERIPNNWYRRPIEYPYDNQYFLADLANAGLVYPKFFDIGGNLGKTNSFTGVNVTDLSGGVYNAQTLTQGDNFACLAYEFSTQAKPDIALTSFTALDSAISKLTSAMSCPQLSKIDASQLKQFPGYMKSQ